ncbi:hypothetical protein WJ62_03010 [Burkholderia diffusa]|nr:hypothetical protein WJ62_03010 [Burkholderia diffusa]
MPEAKAGVPTMFVARPFDKSLCSILVFQVDAVLEIANDFWVMLKADQIVDVRFVEGHES